MTHNTAFFRYMDSFFYFYKSNKLNFSNQIKKSKLSNFVCLFFAIKNFAIKCWNPNFSLKKNLDIIAVIIIFVCDSTMLFEGSIYFNEKFVNTTANIQKNERANKSLSWSDGPNRGIFLYFRTQIMLISCIKYLNTELSLPFIETAIL